MTDGTGHGKRTGKSFATHVVVGLVAFAGGLMWNGQQADRLDFDSAVRITMQADPREPATAAALMRVFAVTVNGASVLQTVQRRGDQLSARASTMIDALREKLRS